ncbi:hypothetical protein MASR2M78_31080 [Treponema sp.]
MNTLDCIVLAAGNARRMGAWKLLLPWKGTTVIEASIFSALQASARVILVCGYHHEELEHIFRSEGRVHCVYNPSWEEGMFSSIRKGVEEVQTEAFFISLGDMPGIRSDDYLAINEAVKLADRGIEGAAFRPRYNKDLGHPVLLGSDAIPLIGGLDNKGSMRDVLSKLEVHEIESNSPGVVLDVDTSEAYHTALLLPEKSTDPSELSKKKLILITGSIGSGKTSLCRAAYSSLSQNGQSCRGLAQVAGDRAQDGTASEYDLHFLGPELEKAIPLARRAPIELKNIPMEDRIVLGPIVFDGQAFERAEEFLRNTQGTKFFILDEIGKLEMDRALGLRRSLDYILSLDESVLIACVRKDRKDMMAAYALNLGCGLYCIDLDMMKGGLRTALASLESLAKLL